jgi:sarcosine oxidase/L-pipecolate oxidase
MDDGNLIGTIFLDLKKAFDTVDYFILGIKLHYYKKSPGNLAWFKSYLSSRTQKIGIGNNISNHEPVKQGVSQGSILGTLLFILFINDLPLENIL